MKPFNLIISVCFGLTLFGTLPSLAQGLACLDLEGLNIGCTSSIDHTCKMNKPLDSENEPCKYGGGYNTMTRVEGPIAFQCKSSRVTRTCSEVCTADSCKEVCKSTSECTEYFPPTCKEECVGCYQAIETALIGKTRGCLICTGRDYCADETLTSLCPNWHNGLMRTGLMQCTTSSLCPKTAVDPLGMVHDVKITKIDCPPEPEPLDPNTPPPPLLHCPWLVDKRSATGCEPIDPDNKNPLAQ